MSKIPEELRYTKSHEWAQQGPEGELTIGISDHAQEQLGDLVYVDLPEPGRHIEAGGEAAVVESVKAAADVYSPVAGEVVAINEALVDSPELINGDAYGEGWIFRLRPDNAEDWSGMLDSVDYAHVVEEEH
ncbi:MAG: glycine cleavage system protein GcvH [Gammaproteobacteria bacterium]|nr:MAG: glycine cleavage system protein GcvH [Gammaproteobacteria bacterium]